MHVLSLSFENYRNLENDTIKPCKKTNIICGNNAQGKTNLLEALWLFCGGHSFRGAKDNEFVKFGENFAKIKINFFAFEREQSAEILINGGKKEVTVNGIKKSSPSALIEKYTAVIFSPEDLSLVKRGPSKRRKFIDSAICREKLSNAVIISKYKQTLNQRNALLKDIYKHPELEGTLDIWDDTLCNLGSEIVLKRLEYIDKLEGYAEKYHNGISNGNEKLEISYICSFNASLQDDRNKIYEKLSLAMHESRKEDLFTGFTNVGPHRDDFDITINGKKSRIFASQGQQRSAVLSLKLAEAKVLKELTGENPVILLDDVLSELDEKRREFLINKITDYQVFITCCDSDVVRIEKDKKIFNVDKGKVM